MNEDKLEEVYQFMLAMKSAASIPFEVDGAIRTRFSDLVTGLAVSAKGANTEDVTVNEGGAASYAVMNDPDGFLEITIGGTVYYVPYFT